MLDFIFIEPLEINYQKVTVSILVVQPSLIQSIMNIQNVPETF